MPTFNDLYYAEMGNARLRPENTNQYDVGINLEDTPDGRGWLRAYGLRMDAYYNTGADKIIAYPKGQQFRWTMLNLGRVHIWGADVLLSTILQPAPAW